MKKYIREFKEFAVKGNVVDLAVAVIIGGAFGKIVSSLVADVVMPIIGVLLGGVSFASWKLTLKQAVLDNSGAIKTAAVTMNIGSFIQNIFDFLIIAVVIFLMVKIIGRLRRQLIKEEPKEEITEEKISDEVKLLGEIRDLLKK